MLIKMIPEREFEPEFELVLDSYSDFWNKLC